jgi:hypothetical protein
MTTLKNAFIAVLVLAPATVAAQGYTYVTPNYGGGYTMSTPGAQHPYTYATPNYGGGYTFSTPGASNPYSYATPNYGGGYTITTPGAGFGSPRSPYDR